jgi:hypothetical protein
VVRRYRLVSLVVLCCAAASVGCGTGIKGDAVPAATSTAAGSGEAPASGAASGTATPDGGSGADASTPTEGELLAAADLPAGAKLQSIDIAKLAAALASAARQITFDPPQCGQLSTRSLGDPSTLQGVAVLASIGNPTSAAQITESVLGKQPSVSIAGLRMALQACGNASGKGPGGTVKVTAKEIELPGVDSSQKIAFHQHATGGLYGQRGLDSDSATLIVGQKVVNVSVIGDTGITLVAVAKKALAKIKH